MTTDPLTRLRRVWDSVFSCRFHGDLYTEANVTPEQAPDKRALLPLHGETRTVVDVDGKLCCPECTVPMLRRFHRPVPRHV